MTGHYLVTSVSRLTSAASGRSYRTIEDAHRSANAILGKVADSVWIVDREGNLILSADQVRLRRSPSFPSPSRPVA